MLGSLTLPSGGVTLWYCLPRHLLLLLTLQNYQQHPLHSRNCLSVQDKLYSHPTQAPHYSSPIQSCLTPKKPSFLPSIPLSINTLSIRARVLESVKLGKAIWYCECMPSQRTEHFSLQTILNWHFRQYNLHEDNNQTKQKKMALGR